MIELRNVSKYYHENDTVVRALEKISLTLRKGEFVVVTGESGSGKSTLLNLIGGLDRYEAGEMLVDERETSYFSQADFETYRRTNIGFIFQDYNIIESYTVRENIEVALLFTDMNKADRKQRTRQIAERVGLGKLLNQKASTLSGGEKQRVAIARALSKDAPIILADEPTGNLDREAGEKILDLLKSLSRDRLVIVVSHSDEVAEQFATRHVRLFDGRIVEDRAFEVEPEASRLRVAREGRPFLRIGGLLRLAFTNLKAMPRKSLFTLLVALFVVGIFAYTYGAYVEQTATTLGTSHPFFDNPDERRVVVSRGDDEPFDEDELQTLGEDPRVQGIVPFDGILDRHFYLASDNGRRGARITPFHAGALESGDLDGGRLPEHQEEIVVTGERQVGEVVELNYDLQTPYGSNGQKTEKEIVGVLDTDAGRFTDRVYFHEMFFHDDAVRYHALSDHHTYYLSFLDASQELSPRSLMVDDSLEVGTMSIPRSQLEGAVDEPDDLLGETFTIHTTERFSNETFSIEATLAETNEEGILRIHPRTLYDIYEGLEPYQITLVAADRHAAADLAGSLSSDDYTTILPGDYEDEMNQLFGVVLQLFQGGLSILLLVVFYFLAYLSLRNVMRSRTKDFVILRSLGAAKKDLNRLTVVEFALTMLLAMLAVVVFMQLDSLYMGWLPSYIRFFDPGNYLIMVTALLALSILLAHRFNQRIFATSVKSAFKEAGDRA